MHPEPFARGTADFAAFYGMLIGGLRDAATSTASAYNQLQPAPDEEIPQRFARAEEVFAGKLWREQLREWDETAKPAAIAKHREIQAVDPDALSDDELAAYLDALPRPPRRDDHPAHALHGGRRCPDRRLPRARRRLDAACRPPSCSA